MPDSFIKGETMPVRDTNEPVALITRIILTPRLGSLPRDARPRRKLGEPGLIISHRLSSFPFATLPPLTLTLCSSVDRQPTWIVSLSDRIPNPALAIPILIVTSRI